MYLVLETSIPPEQILYVLDLNGYKVLKAFEATTMQNVEYVINFTDWQLTLAKTVWWVRFTSLTFVVSCVSYRTNAGGNERNHNQQCLQCQQQQDDHDSDHGGGTYRCNVL